MRTIVAKARPVPDITAKGLKALEVANDPPELFVRLGELARVRADEKGNPLIDRVSERLLAHRLERVAKWVRINREGQEVPVPVPKEVIGDLLAMKAWPFPPLEGVTELPILRPDGTVLDRPGYDPTTRLVYRPRPGALPTVPFNPSPADLRQAVTALVDIFGEFPFVDRASTTNTIALLLTPIVRPAIAGCVPMALVDKPKRGTGATLLVQVITSITIGSDTDVQTAPADDEEWRKVITAGLRAGMPCMFFDNIETELTSASLAAALTAKIWNQRILGETRMSGPLPQRATWMGTGNNLKVGGDLARRCYPIRLDAEVAQPWTRNGWKHPDLLGTVRQRRCDLLVALLTLARAWWAAGQPRVKTPTLGSFDEWARTLGGILGHAGFRDFLGNLDLLYAQMDEEETAWTAFFTTWHELWGDRAFTAKELTAALQDGAIPLRDVLPGDLGTHLTKDPEKFSQRLGTALRKRDGAVFGQHRLGRAGLLSGAVLWCVRPAPSPTEQATTRYFPDLGVAEGPA
jgi:hypothetical protein